MTLRRLVSVTGVAAAVLLPPEIVVITARAWAAPGTCVSYQQVWREEERTVTVYKRVSREEAFEYTVCKQVVTPERRKVQVCQNVMKEVDVKYIECVPVMTQEKRNVTRMTTVTKEVEVSVNECVPTTKVENTQGVAIHQRADDRRVRSSGVFDSHDPLLRSLRRRQLHLPSRLHDAEGSTNRHAVRVEGS